MHIERKQRQQAKFHRSPPLKKQNQADTGTKSTFSLTEKRTLMPIMRSWLGETTWLDRKMSPSLILAVAAVCKSRKLMLCDNSRCKSTCEPYSMAAKSSSEPPNGRMPCSARVPFIRKMICCLKFYQLLFRLLQLAGICVCNIPEFFNVGKYKTLGHSDAFTVAELPR